MSPQPAAQQQEKAPDKAEQEKAAQEAADKQWKELVKAATDGDSSASRQIKRAMDLEKQRGDLMEKIGSNREYLRLMDRNEELTDEQSEFLDTFYPEKEKGERRDAGEVEATRRARAAARKNGADA